MKRTLVVDQKGCQWRTVPKNSHKNQRYPQKSMFTVTRGPTDMPLVVLE